MAYVIGIDTGGTYTDAVLIDTKRPKGEQIEKKSKAFTFHHELEVSIKNSIAKLSLSREQISRVEKVVLSTTLATNAIVEGTIHPVGLIIIGEKPKGALASDMVKTVAGGVNIKGRIINNISKEEIQEVVSELAKTVRAIAVSGAASVRNPILEQEVKKIIVEQTGLPVICGHEIVSDLGFLERTNTAVINAGLLPIIAGFTKAITNVLREYDIHAPVFLVRGDGSIAKLEAIKDRPIDTVLSGPAASMIGAINLTGLEDAIVSDMGGTTTDMGIIRGKRVELSPDGATIGNWKIRVKSAKLHTFGLGGDSSVRRVDGMMKIGPKRALPVCRGGVEITPTDILHYTKEFTQWSQSDAVAAINKMAEENGMEPGEFVEQAEEAICSQIIEEIISLHRTSGLPVCAIGAPSKVWYGKAKKRVEFDLVIPENYEVANAVGAATAVIEEASEATVRIGEDGYGYLAHTAVGRFSFSKKEEAVKEAIRASRDHVIGLIENQKLGLEYIKIHCRDVYGGDQHLVYDEIQVDENGDILGASNENLGKYLETTIKVVAKGRILTDEIQ